VAFRGRFHRLRILESESAPEAWFDGKNLVNLASNHCLGLT